MATDPLTAEIERQKKALAELPQDFTFPLFNLTSPHRVVRTEF